MLHVLMVDDEPDLSVLIKQRFRKEINNNEYKFTFTYNGSDALEKLQETKDTDLVITDLNMPKMNGLELLINIKKYYPDLDVMVMSAYSDPEVIKSAMNAGAVNFIFKPINFKNFNEQLQKYCIKD